MLGANVVSILERLQLGAEEGACSWLPLSHDMGLVGMLIAGIVGAGPSYRSEEHTSELQSLMRISYAVFCLKKKKTKNTHIHIQSLRYKRKNTQTKQARS